MNPLSPATCYFLEYWEDLWSGVSSQRDLLTSFNPRVVIKELLDELTFNKQGNKANESFFKRTLGDYLKSDPGSQKRLKLHHQMMVAEFDLIRSRPLYLPKLCDTSLKLFEELAYFEDCIDALFGLIDEPMFDAQEKEKVRLIVNHLIVELREIGYMDDEIRNAPRKAFSTISVHPEGNIVWEFPHPFVCDDWEDASKVQEYRKNLEEYQTSLTERDRLQALLTFARAAKHSFRFIFRVNGMTGSEEIEVNQVLFYSPSKKRLVSDQQRIDLENKYELFGAEADEQVINASVVVGAISVTAGEAVARSNVEKALALCRRIMDGGSPLWMNKSYIALNEQGRILSASHFTFERPSDDWTKAFVLNATTIVHMKPNLDAIEKTRVVAIENGWERRFYESCSWLRKAEESSSYVEKFLSYWICIETLCAKSDDEVSNWFETKGGQVESDIFLIKEVVGKMRAVGKCYRHGWMVYHQLSTPSFRPKKSPIPKELSDRAQLTPEIGEMVSLRNFINCCGEIEKILPEGLFKDQVAELRGFYGDNKNALKVLKGHLRSTQDELAFIYRMRNKIAHDGSSDHPLLPSLCKLAEEYARSLFHQVGHYVVERKELDLDAVLIAAVQDYDRIEMRLQTESPMFVLLEQV